MVKIAIASDLHREITPEAKVRALAACIAAEQPDLTILAGDLGTPLDDFAACLACFADLPGAVAVLAGNHDVWALGGRHSQTLWEHDLPAATHAAGMLWLEEAVWRRAGVAVVGSMAWYDYSGVDPTIRPRSPRDFARAKRRYNNDARFVDWPWSDLEMASRLDDALCDRLMRLESDPAVRGVLVVTHVPVFEAQMERRPLDPRWGFSNAYFGNLTLGRRLSASSKLRAVVSGHTHVGRSGYVDRPGAPDDPVPVAVIASDYGAPDHVTIEADW